MLLPSREQIDDEHRATVQMDPPRWAADRGRRRRIHEGEGLLLPSRERIDDDSTTVGGEWSGGCCCYCDDSTKKTEMGLGIEGDAAPRSKMKLPGAAQRRRRVADGFKKPGALIPCYDRGEEEERVNWLVVLREALWAYIYMRHTPNPRIEEKTILPLTIIL